MNNWILLGLNIVSIAGGVFFNVGSLCFPHLLARSGSSLANPRFMQRLRFIGVCGLVMAVSGTFLLGARIAAMNK